MRYFLERVMRNVATRVAVSVVLALIFALGHHLAKAGNMLDPVGQVSGSCQTGYSCSGGDPVECAQAVAMAEVACIYKPDQRDLSVILNNAGLDKTLDEVATSSTVEIPLLQSAASLASGCPPDVNLVLLGTSVSLRLGPLCQVFEISGFVVLLGAALTAAKLFAGV